MNPHLDLSHAAVGLRATCRDAACATATLALAASAWAGCNTSIVPTRPDNRYEAVAGAVPAGSEVLDTVTGLVWQRCVLGMAWDGSTCTGRANLRTWVQALEATRTAPASAAPGAGAWRMPDMKELVSLAETACVAPAINTTWFGAQPIGSVWSSTPDAHYVAFAWVVNFSDGVSFTGYKRSTGPVRLVRSGR